jgi:hypothetical protein
VSASVSISGERRFAVDHYTRRSGRGAPQIEADLTPDFRFLFSGHSGPSECPGHIQKQPGALGKGIGEALGRERNCALENQLATGSGQQLLSLTAAKNFQTALVARFLIFSSGAVGPKGDLERGYTGAECLDEFYTDE